jgi:class 3 adenylate cyclase
MRRRSRESGKLAKARRQKAGMRNLTPVRRRGSSDAGQEAEVVRLRRELEEAREQQTVAADVLQVISRSTFDLRAVLDTLVESAARVCEALNATIYLRDSDVAVIHSHFGPLEVTPVGTRQVLNINWVGGHAMLEARTVHVPDLLNSDEYPEGRKIASRLGHRTTLAVPLFRNETAIGAILLRRQEVRPFTDRQIAQGQNFAAQAVIAIENARLLNELRESLQQQTATADVLRIISSSPGDLEPVFDAILKNATEICEAKFGQIFSYDDGLIQKVAHVNDPPALAAWDDRMGRHPPVTDGPLERVIRSKHVVHIADISCELNEHPAGKLGGAKALLAVPMIKGDKLVGILVIYRQEARAFADKQIALVQNFASQAVIAIENARLLDDLNKLNQQLEQRVADQVGEIERMSRLRRFLPPQVADLIVASGTEKQLESHRREITALFCDLRGFTGFSESSDPEDVMALLRDYHGAIGKIIIKYSGTLERYAGDGVMVVFNDPVPVENPALQAVLMALEMRDAIGALTETWHRWGHDIGFGIGIAHGFATLGTIGFEGRFDYAAIGTVSNVASRLCDEAKPGQILISPRVLTKVENAVTVELVGEFTLKGIRRPMMAYNVLESSPSKLN